MPNRWPISSGNWSNAAIWSGSLIPTASDDVYANNFNVNIDISFQVLTLRNSASASAVVAGGSFNFNSGSISGSCTAATSLFYSTSIPNLIQVTAPTGTVTLTLGGVLASVGVATNVVRILHSGNCDFVLIGTTITTDQIGGANPFINKTSSGSITINANLNGFNNQPILASSAGNTIINGNVTAGASSAANSSIVHTGGSITVNGDVRGSGNAFAVGIVFTSTTTPSTSFIRINGNVIASQAPGINSVVPVTVNGNVFGSTAGGAGITTSTTGSIIITGSVFGTTGTGTGITSTSTATITVSGSIIPLNNTPAISATGASEINIIGNISASALSPAVSSTNANSRVNLTGNILNVNGKMAIYAPTLFISNTTPTTANFSITGGNSKAFYSEDVPSNTPSASNVRSGTTYSGSLVGTITIPSSSDVRSGITYDTNNSVTGSAIVTTNLLLNEISSSSSPVAIRIRNAATPEIFGELMEAFKK